MGTSRRTLEKVTYVVTKINEILLLIAISIMFLLVFINVIGRYFFANSLSWAAEVSRYLMVSIAFLGMGLAMKQGRHSAFYIFQDLLPQSLRKFVRIIIALIIIAIMCILLVLGAQYAFKYMGNLTEVLRWPVGYFVTSIAEYVNKKKDADLEAEIQAGEELIEDSIFLQKMRDVETATDEEEERY